MMAIKTQVELIFNPCLSSQLHMIDERNCWRRNVWEKQHCEYLLLESLHGAKIFSQFAYLKIA